MRFKNREQAAELLSEKLSDYRGKNPLVLGIPRGAIPMAGIIADRLEGELDVVLVHKLGAPGQPELAIGAIDETGHVQLGEYARELAISASYLETEKKSQLKNLLQRRSLYTPHRAPIDPRNRIVIVVDDGVATGSTLLAALQALRAKKPQKLVAAFAVAPFATLRKIKAGADEVICLYAPDEFFAVSQFFDDFGQVSDEQVVEILNRGQQKKAVGE